MANRNNNFDERGPPTAKPANFWLSEPIDIIDFPAIYGVGWAEVILINPAMAFGP